MHTYKNFDLFGQLILIVTGVAGYLFDESGAMASISIIAFAVLQIVSLIVHAGQRRVAWKSPLRKIHLIGVVLVIMVMIYGFIKPGEDKYDFSGLKIIIRALIPAAAVALFYTMITFLEWKKLKGK